MARHTEIVSRLRGLFEATHWAQGQYILRQFSGRSYVMPDEMLPAKMRFCLLGGLRFVQVQYENAVLENLTDEEWIEEHYEAATEQVHTPDSDPDTEVLAAIVQAVEERDPEWWTSEGYDTGRSGHNSLSETERLEEVIINFNDYSEHELDDIVWVLTRAGEILAETPSEAVPVG